MNLKARLAVLLVFAGFLPAPAMVPSFADGNMNGWTSSLLVGGACPGLATTTPVSGGNPGAFPSYTQSACGPMMAGHFSAFSWNPATQGATTSMTIGYDADWQGGSFSGDTRIGTNAMIRQGGAVFVALYSEISSLPWSHFAAVLTPASWQGLNSASTPDFTPQGGLIEFGIPTSDNCPQCGKTLSGGLDNYQVNLAYTAPVPEPSSWALLTAGVFGIQAAARRRHSPR